MLTQGMFDRNFDGGGSSLQLVSWQRLWTRLIHFIQRSEQGLCRSGALQENPGTSKSQMFLIRSAGGGHP